jgi:hypothetical protein
MHHALWKQDQIVVSDAIHSVKKFHPAVHKHVFRVRVLGRLVVMVESN